MKLLNPGESLTGSVFVSAGLDGWHLAEPGSYSLHARLHSAAGDIVAEPLTLRITYPGSRDQDRFAQDFFTDDVGRTLAVGGSCVMASAIAALEEAATRFDSCAVARYAALVLALPMMQSCKVLQLNEGTSPMSSVAADGGKIRRTQPKQEEAKRLLGLALEDPRLGVGIFGTRPYRLYREMFAKWLESNGDPASASGLRENLDNRRR
jgi:hypothetical protein